MPTAAAVFQFHAREANDSTWSARDAFRKRSCISDLLVVLAWRSRPRGQPNVPEYTPVVPLDPLTDDQREIRELIRELARERIAPRAADIDKTAEFPWDIVELY